MGASRIHPASCSRCGAHVVDTLWSDHRVPLYACGSTPYSFVCSAIPEPLFAHIHARNVTPLQVDDIDELASILDLFAIAWAPE